MYITEIQRFSTHDGPGVRTTVFLKGCPLSCLWCHNPEAVSPRPQVFFHPSRCIGCGACEAVCPQKCHMLAEIHEFHPDNCTGCLACADVCPSNACETVAKEMAVDEIVAEVLRDTVFYGKAGGVTLSGGEPLAQKESVEILRQCKEAGVSTAVETCGYVERDILLRTVPVTDLFLWDIKGCDREQHQKNTGVYPDRIHDNLRLIDSLGAKTVIRCIAVKGRNMSESDLDGIAALYHDLIHCDGVEILPYHAYGSSKSAELGHGENGHPEWIPDADFLVQIRTRLTQKGVTIIDGTS